MDSLNDVRYWFFNSVIHENIINGSGYNVGLIFFSDLKIDVLLTGNYY